jgi:hypothetical protein
VRKSDLVLTLSRGSASNLGPSGPQLPRQHDSLVFQMLQDRTFLVTIYIATTTQKVAV